MQYKAVRTLRTEQKGSRTARAMGCCLPSKCNAPPPPPQPLSPSSQEAPQPLIKTEPAGEEPKKTWEKRPMESPGSRAVLEELKKHPHRYVDIVKQADMPSDDDLEKDKFSGIFLNRRKKKYWVDEKTGCNCFMLYARDLTIVWGEDARYWRWNELQETSNLSIEVAELANVCWLEINGKFEMSYLTPGAAYEVAFVVMISHSSYGWNAPVNLRLTDPQGNVQKRPESLVDKPKGKWIELVVGQLETRAASAGEVEVSLFEYEDGAWKSGLVVKGIRIRPS